MEYREWTPEEREEASAESRRMTDRYAEIQTLKDGALNDCRITPEWEALDQEERALVKNLELRGFRERQDAYGCYRIERCAIVLR